MNYNKQFITVLSRPKDRQVRYSPSFFGFNDVKGTGNGVKICVIDSGVPQHPDIPQPPADSVADFTDSKHGVKDVYGHATAVAGLLVASNPKAVTGLCPKAKMLYAKSIADTGKASIESAVAGVLWAIVKRADIIVMSFGGACDSQVLREAVSKAIRNGLAVFAASGLDGGYPSGFNEVMAVKRSEGKITKDDKNRQIGLPFASLVTTYKNNKIAAFAGSSILAPAVAGVAARLISYEKARRKKMLPSEVYDAIYSRLQNR